MPSYLDIVRSRLNPGILIFDPRNKLAFSNRAALDYLPGLRRGKVPPEILDLCLTLRGHKRSRSPRKEAAHCLVIDSASGSPISLRAFRLQEGSSGQAMMFVLVLVEKIVDRHLADLDFKKIGHDYGLSKRETEVLELICQGLSNVDISKRLFISEYTVKDHIKKILSKMNLVSRSGIIASLLQPPKKRG
ncbi:MAG: helix-turn-helix transcriptional regulator [Candidatus Aminicenantes bacterium]|nr:helix-turn-helix transcriptional regulator [Candidatus Aminicenantes bacterium]